VYRLGALQTAILCLLTVGVALAALPLGILVVALPGMLAAFYAWSTSAFRRGRRWAWWAWAVVSGLDVITGLVQLGAGGSSWSAWYSLAVGAGTLVLLVHPANQDRVNGPVEPFPWNAHPADVGYYR
jgi:hypothetical protein